MYLLPIFLLSIVQGITEFLPVSSSAHLIILAQYINFSDESLIIDISLHLGTLLAVCIFFRSDIFIIFKSFIFSDNAEGKSLGINIVIATIPITLIGGIVYSLGLVDILRNPQMIALSTIVFGILLYFADIKSSSKTKSLEDLNFKEASIIGLFQTLSIIPGASRSGVAYTACRFLNTSRLDALRFSMLISIPAIFLSSAIPTIEFLNSPSYDQLLLCIIGFCISFVIAYFTISILMQWVKKHSMKIFVIYRIILGSVILALTFI